MLISWIAEPKLGTAQPHLFFLFWGSPLTLGCHSQFIVAGNESVHPEPLAVIKDSFGINTERVVEKYLGLLFVSLSVQLFSCKPNQTYVDSWLSFDLPIKKNAATNRIPTV